MSTVGVFVSLFDSSGRILLVRHAYDSRQWSTPGGRVEPGESPVIALLREVAEEIACEIRISHLIGVYAKPYRDDFVLSFHATIVSGIPHACPPEISDVVFFSRDSLPPELEFTRRIRIEDAFGGCRGIVRVFDSADSWPPHSTRMYLDTPRPNQTMRPIAVRRTASLSMISTHIHSKQHLALASGG